MRKQFYLIFGLFILFIVILNFINIYYPPLPLNSVSKSEVVNKVNQSNGKIVKIAEENSYQWYIAEVKHGKGYENLKKLMADKGWYFKDQLDSGLVFQSKQGEIIVQSEMWTKKYVIFHFPKGI